MTDRHRKISSSLRDQPQHSKKPQRCRSSSSSGRSRSDKEKSIPHRRKYDSSSSSSVEKRSYRT